MVEVSLLYTNLQIMFEPVTICPGSRINRTIDKESNMRLSEIYDESDDFVEWMYDDHIVDVDTGQAITEENQDEDIRDQIDTHDGKAYITNYTGECNFAFSARKKLTPPIPIGGADAIAYGYGPYSNMIDCWPLETPNTVEFHRVTDISVEDLVNKLKDIDDVRVKFSGCTFTGNFANFMDLPISNPDNFYMVGDMPNIDKLIELFREGFENNSTPFEFQEMLIENGFEDLV